MEKLVAKLPQAIFDQLHEKYGDKVEEENAKKKEQNYRHKLPNYYNLSHVVQLIEKSSNILVLAGAGISTSANIPDFRSKGGLYDKFGQNQDIKTKIKDPTNMFDLEYFLKDPSVFYKYGTSKLFDKRRHYQATKTHYFIKALQDKNKLKRVHTQNVDGLELNAGILDNKINHCHGTISSYTCVNCMFSIDAKSQFIQQHLRKAIPYC